MATVNTRESTFDAPKKIVFLDLYHTTVFDFPFVVQFDRTNSDNLPNPVDIYIWPKDGASCYRSIIHDVPYIRVSLSSSFPYRDIPLERDPSTHRYSTFIIICQSRKQRNRVILARIRSSFSGTSRKRNYPTFPRIIIER